ERDAIVGRARVLARARRTDAAIAAYEQWLAAHPTDAEAWRELGRERTRAGLPAEAAQALERAQALAPDGATARRLAMAQVAAAPALAPQVSGSHDSDGNTTLRLGSAAEPQRRVAVRVVAAAHLGRERGRCRDLRHGEPPGRGPVGRERLGALQRLGRLGRKPGPCPLPSELPPRLRVRGVRGEPLLVRRDGGVGPPRAGKDARPPHDRVALAGGEAQGVVVPL